MTDSNTSTTGARFALAIAILVGLIAVASGVGAAAVASDDPVDDRPTVQATVSPSEAVFQVNDTTAADEPATTTDADAAENESTTGETDDGVPAGARLAGVIGAQETEHRTAVASRAFEKAFENAGTNASRAAVVADRTGLIEAQLRELETERDRLQDRYDAGNVSNGSYHARMTVIDAQLRGLEYRANHTAVRGTSLPAPALERAGVSEERLRTIENRTANARVSANAATPSTVRGPPPGVPMGPSTNGPGMTQGGPPDTPGQSTTGPANVNDTRSGPRNETRGPNGQITGGSDGSDTGNSSDVGQLNAMRGGLPGADHTQQAESGNGGPQRQGTPAFERGLPSVDRSRPGKASGNASSPGSGNGVGSMFADVGAVEFLFGYLR